MGGLGHRIAAGEPPSALPPGAVVFPGAVRTLVPVAVTRISLVAILGLTGPASLAGQTPSAVVRDAARWLRVDRLPGFAVVYIDRLRTTLVDSAHVQTWIRWDVADTLMKTPKKVDQMIMRWAIDCRRLEAVDVENALYYRGNSVEHYVIPVQDRTLETAAPEGALETWIAAACLVAKGVRVDSVP